MRMIAGLIENLSSRWKPSFLGLLHFLKILVLNVFELTRMKPVQFSTKIAGVSLSIILHELHAYIRFLLRFLDFSPVIRINCEFEEQLQRALQNLQ